jgi:erythromycin esterase-like protein
LGQLVRQRYGKDAVLVGFSTYTGTVTAASDWDGPAERKYVRPRTPRELRIAVSSKRRSQFPTSA